MHDEKRNRKSMQRDGRTSLSGAQASPFPGGGRPPSRAAARQVIAGVLAASMLPASLSAALGQDYGAPPPPPDSGYGAPASRNQPQGPEQLDQLVAPIALYPDSLVAQVLAAATYPAQVASAQQFLAANSTYPPEQLAELANTQPWDPSVKALVAFPQVVDTLNRNMDWTTQLGNAYYNQPQDVLGAVQAMRQRAYAAGSLRPTQQLAVNYSPSAIVIEPVNPAVVYVPYYNPWVVYGAPVPVYGHYYYGGPPRGVVFGAGLAIGFGVGLAIGAFTHFSWGFHSWAPNWGQRTIVYNHNTYISNSVTVVNHGNYGRFDRAPEARAFNQQQAARFSNVGNHTTINNVTVNRGGNTYNNGGNTYNRGGNTFNNGGNTVNRGGSTFNNSGNTVNRGASPYNNGAGAANRGAYNGSYNNGASAGYRGSQPAPGGNTFGRPGGAPPQQPYASQARPQQPYASQGRPQQGAQFNPQQAGPRPPQQGGQFNPQQAGPRPPQQGYAQRPQGGAPQTARPQPQPQQHSAPRENRGNEGGHEDHGGGHGDHR